MEYVKEAIFPGQSGPAGSEAVSSEAGPTGPGPVPTAGTSGSFGSFGPSPSPTHLVDTYCGSGLFGITLSSSFQRVAGVEISQDSITAAKRNAEMNGLGEKTEWLCGKAEDIFGGLAEKGFEGGKSCVVCDVGLSFTSHAGPCHVMAMGIVCLAAARGWILAFARA